MELIRMDPGVMNECANEEPWVSEDVCPLCGNDVTRTPCRIPPYVIPSPFEDAGRHPCSVIIKPTVGSFLHNYDSQSDLHVGVTDSSGCAWDYNENGINRGLIWSQCVVIELVKDDYHLHQRWDTVLHQMSRSQTWQRSRYDEKRNNCFDFVLTFLQSFDLERRLPAIRSKHTFCEEIVVKHTRKAAIYISLYRKIVKDGFVIQNI